MKIKLEDWIDMYPQVMCWDGVHTGDRETITHLSTMVSGLLPSRSERDWSIADMRYEYYAIDKDGFYRRKP
jgi:hypothetical protein